MNKSTAEIRQTFLNFFHKKGHKVIASSSLVPDNDPTLLFTNAGMNQFKDIFLGLENRAYQRATTSQRCLRAGGKHNDLDNVGYTARHHTFFEMLGNFSFGDYFKYDAIRFVWELLTGKEWFNLSEDKFLVTVHVIDDEAYNIWNKEIGISTEHIIRIGDTKDSIYNSNNFWQMGDTGPCGLCSEIFYDQGEHISGGPPGSSEEDGDRYIEICNLVFIQFNRQANGDLFPLPKPSVDTGMGLERIAAVLQHVTSNYDIDLFKTLITVAAQVTSTRDLDSKSLRVIVDHIRSCAFLISDGVIPSNEGRGYVLRRIIRRAIRHGKMLGANDIFFYKLITPLIEAMGAVANQIKSKKNMIEQILRAEEKQFTRTLERGLTLLDEKLSNLTGNILDGETAFRLHDTYGFPLDLTADICRERNLRVDKLGFERAMLLQRKRSRASRNFTENNNSILRIDKITQFCGYEKLKYQGEVIALLRDGALIDTIYQNENAMVILDKTPFYGEAGGQLGDQGTLKSVTGTFNVADTKKYKKALIHLGKVSCGKLKLGDQVVANVDSTYRERIRLNHSATHLLHATLRQLLGKYIEQKGSLVNDQYLRLDFFYYVPIKPKQIRQIEDIVNAQIRRNLSIQTEIMSIEDARKKGAIALFNEKYETQVRVISIGDFSTELCCGTHANRTGDIGLFRITSESSIATGIRRIEALTGELALASFHQQSDLIHHITRLVKSDSKTLADKIQTLQEHSRRLEKSLQKIKNHQAMQKSALLAKNARDIKGVKIIVSQLDNIEPKILRVITNNLKNQLSSAIIVLATIAENKINIISGVTDNLTKRIKASDIIKHLAQQVGGKGGGNADLAQAGGNNISALPSALANLDSKLVEKLYDE